jgi:hypothetical protein
LNAQTIVLLAVVAAAGGCAASGRGGGTGAAESAPAGQTPREVAVEFNAACRAGDVERAMSLALAPSEADREHVRSLVAMRSATERLRGAVAERFGPEAAAEPDFRLSDDEAFERAVSHAGDGGVSAGEGLMVIVMLAALRESARENGGDLAAAATPLTRRGGRWLVDARQAKPGGAGYTPGPRFNFLLARAADQTAADVRAGKFAEAKEMATAFQSLVMSELLRDVLPPPARPVQ